MTHDEMIEVIAAHRDGKVIQYRLRPKGPWRDLRLSITDFNFTDIEYRIKPEPLSLLQCWNMRPLGTDYTVDVIVEFIKLLKENGHA